ncbi:MULTISPECIES: hypothetical protein [Actinoplanes]|uniref:hypothetical protein n=1 Tax=Actinoplanes TaxID=1865 RepID=UPI0005F2A6D5|nr:MULTISPECIES: hypothetical protein [Actinoplanes]GLY06282.1 hypothetical protein Acsp01_66610 [Actinoplanes sp. NBRC 101535]
MSRALVLTAALALGLALTGCSSAKTDEEATAAVPAAPASAAAASGTTSPEMRASIEAQLGFPPAPNPQTTAAYLADLKTISPAIISTGTPESLVNRGRDQCRDIKQLPEAQWTTRAGERFASPEQPLPAAEAEKVVQVVRKRLCPSF